MRKKIFIGALAILVSFVLVQTGWADQWRKNGGDCDTTAFQTPGSVSKGTLARCVRLFAAYHDPAKLGAPYKKRVKRAAMRLFKQGSDLNAHIAFWLLRRLGVTTLTPRQSSGSSSAPTIGSTKSNNTVKTVTISKKKCRRPLPDAKQIKTAKKFLKAGNKHRKKEAYGKARVEYQKMIEIAPGWARGIYRMAELYVKLDKPAKALHLLKCLRDIGTKSHFAELRDARFDEDFAPLRDMVPFKKLTGYAKIVIVDTLTKDRGVQNLEAFVVLLKKIHYEPYQQKSIGGNRTYPTLVYAPASRGVAYLISKLIDHDGLKIEVMPAPFYKKYHKGKGYDIVFFWGDRFVKGKEPRKRFPDPKAADNLLSDLSRKQDDMMRKPDKYEREVDKVLGKPEEVEKKVGSTVDKAEKVINKPKEAVDKVKGWGDKVKKIF